MENSELIRKKIVKQQTRLNFLYHVSSDAETIQSTLAYHLGAIEKAETLILHHQDAIRRLEADRENADENICRCKKKLEFLHRQLELLKVDEYVAAYKKLKERIGRLEC